MIAGSVRQALRRRFQICARSHPWLLRAYGHVPLFRPWGVRRAAQVEDGISALDVAEKVLLTWPREIAKPRVGLVRDWQRPPSWIKYGRFCQNNGLFHEFYEIHAYNWMEEAGRFDLIVGHPSGTPSRLDELWRKTYILERLLGKQCYPALDDLDMYEDKHMQFSVLRLLKFPVIPTWISYDERDALRLAATLKYPLVSKLITGAGAMGVAMIKSSAEAERFIRKVFSPHGCYRHWPYLRQKDYVLFQEFIPNDGYDVRVICVGDLAFGYYRRAASGDFRASGSGIYEKRELPEQVVHTAHRVAQALNAPYLSVDFLRNTVGEYLIIEIAHFNQIDTPEQLHVDGVPGAYMVDGDKPVRFVPGRFWVQELALKRVCERYIARRQQDGTQNMGCDWPQSVGRVPAS